MKRILSFVKYESEKRKNASVDVPNDLIFVRCLSNPFFLIEMSHFLSLKQILNLKLLCKRTNQILTKLESIILRTQKNFEHAINSSQFQIIKTKFIPFDWINCDLAFDRNRAIRMASKKGDFHFIELLLSHNQHFPKLDPSDFGNSAIRLACQNGHFQTANYLFSLRSQFPKIAPEQDFIILATLAGSLEIIQLLISLKNEFPAQIDPSHEENEAIVVAAQKGRLDLVKYFVSLQSEFPNIDPHDRDGRAFLKACSNGHLDVAKYLLTLPGAQKISLSVNGSEILLLAARNGHFETCQFLVSLRDRDHDFNLSDSSFIQAAQGGNLNIVKYFVELREQFPRSNYLSATAIFHVSLCASQMGYLNIVKYVHETFHIVKFTERDHSALKAAAENGRLEVVQYIVEKILKGNLKGTKAWFEDWSTQSARRNATNVVDYLNQFKANM